MTIAEVFEQFGTQKPYDLPTFSCGFEIRVDGFDNAILLKTKKVHGKTGKYVLYNLVTGLWEAFASKPSGTPSI